MYALDRLKLEGLVAAWNIANTAILAEGHRLLINNPARFTGVKTFGVDEHVWRLTRRGDKYVTVIIGLSPVREKRGPAQLVDIVVGRSKQVFKTWLEAQTFEWRAGIEIVPMDGLPGPNGSKRGVTRRGRNDGHLPYRPTYWRHA